MRSTGLDVTSLLSRLQVVSASVDELTCRFVDLGGRKHVIHATLTETYPR